MKSKITISGLAKDFWSERQSVRALQNIDLTIADGEFVCIVGPSGCGKTTLLRIVAGLEAASTGTVTIQHDSVARPLNSMVFQEQSVFPWMTVRDNVAFGLRCRGVDRRRREEIRDRYISEVGLKGFGGAFPHELSGGMKQRVSLARAFANDPEVLLMDEPFAALDEQTKIVLQEQLIDIWSRHRKTVLFITHSIDEAIALSDRVVIMSARPGRLKDVVKVDLPRPRRVYEIKASAAYGVLVQRIWSALEEEVRGRADERQSWQ